MVFPIGISIFQGSIFQVSWYLLGVVDLDDWLSFLGTGHKSLCPTHSVDYFPLEPKWEMDLFPEGFIFIMFFPVWLRFDLNCIGGWIWFRFWLHHFLYFNVWGIEGKIITSQHVIRSNHHAWIIDQSGSPAAETFDTDMGYWWVFVPYTSRSKKVDMDQALNNDPVQMMHI